jgi:hypothetical protein
MMKQFAHRAQMVITMMQMHLRPQTTMNAQVAPVVNIFIVLKTVKFVAKAKELFSTDIIWGQQRDN